MTARIYKPAKTAMQSGQGKTRDWVLDYEPEEPRVVESLMGWTSSGDMKGQLRLRFDTNGARLAGVVRRPAARLGAQEALGFVATFARCRALIAERGALAALDDLLGS